MNGPNMLWILCLVFGLVLSLTILLLMTAQVKILKSSISHLTLTVQQREKTIESLMNRLQSGDLKTLLSLNSETSIGVPGVGSYIPRTDAAELAIMGQATGIGQEMFDDAVTNDDEFRDTLSELGIVVE